MKKTSSSRGASSAQKKKIEGADCHNVPAVCKMKMFGTVTVGTKGQIVIPKSVRELLNIAPGDTLVVVTKHNVAVGLVKMDDVTKIATYIQEEMETYKKSSK